MEKISNQFLFKKKVLKKIVFLFIIYRQNVTHVQTLFHHLCIFITFMCIKIHKILFIYKYTYIYLRGIGLFKMYFNTRHYVIESRKKRELSPPARSLSLFPTPIPIH